MKNIFKTGILALLSVLLMTSCDPQENNEYGLGTTPTETDLSFTATPSSSKANIIVLKNTSSVSGVAPKRCPSNKRRITTGWFILRVIFGGVVLKKDLLLTPLCSSRKAGGCDVAPAALSERHVRSLSHKSNRTFSHFSNVGCCRK